MLNEPTLPNSVHLFRGRGKARIEAACPDIENAMLIREQFGIIRKFIAGYLDATTALYELGMRGGLVSGHIWVPLLFNFRHYLELRLKYLIHPLRLNAEAYLDKAVTEPLFVEYVSEIHRDHNILHLSEGCTKFLHFVVPDVSESSAWKRARELIEEMHDADSVSTRFRYPLDFDGMPLRGEQCPLLHANWKDAVQFIDDVFEWAHDSLHQYENKVTAEQLREAMEMGVRKRIVSPTWKIPTAKPRKKKLAKSDRVDKENH